MTAVRETLEPEQMYVETILYECRDGLEYLYWYSVQGDSGLPVETSEHWLDATHNEFWDACIDPSFRPEDLAPMVTMFPERVEAAMRPLA